MNKFFASLLLATSLPALAQSYTAFSSGHLNIDPNGPTRAQAMALMAKLQNPAPDGLVEMGVAFCTEATGVPFDYTNDTSSPVVNCLDIGFVSNETLLKFQTKYPNGSKLDGMYIYSEFVGVIHPE
jgi:hypothetical protein